MTRRFRLLLVPEDVVEAVFEAFCEIVPADVTMTRDSDSLFAETEGLAKGTGYQNAGVGNRPVAAAWIPFAKQRRFEMGLEQFVTVLAKLVSDAVLEPWPPGDRRVHAAIHDRVVRIWFGSADYGSAAVKLPEVDWVGDEP
jgi:hypothetical protein